MTKSIDNDQLNADTSTSHKAVSGSELPQNPTAAPLFGGLWREIKSLVFRCLDKFLMPSIIVGILVFPLFIEDVRTCISADLFGEGDPCLSGACNCSDRSTAGSASCVEDNQD